MIFSFYRPMWGQTPKIIPRGSGMTLCRSKTIRFGVDENTTLRDREENAEISGEPKAKGKSAGRHVDEDTVDGSVARVVHKAIAVNRDRMSCKTFCGDMFLVF